jgi:hypothetical protein
VTCCVAIGTCDSGYISGYRKYYEGGCIGVQYSNRAIASTSIHQNYNISLGHFPATEEGCAKQGECNVPYMEQVYSGYTRAGGALTTAVIADAVMGRLLVGLTEAYQGACRHIYPLTATIENVAQVQTRVTVSGDLSSFDTAALTTLEAVAAAKLNVAPNRVSITASAGSVVLTVVVTYPSAADADTAAASMATTMATPALASSFLSTPSNSITVTSVDNSPTSTDYDPAGAAFSDDGLSRTTLIVIIVCSVVGVVLLAAIAICLMKRNKSTAASGKGSSSAESSV